MLSKPYPYRTRPAQKRWSLAEAAWTKHEQGERPNLAMVLAPEQMSRTFRRAQQFASRRMQRHAARAIRRLIARLQKNPAAEPAALEAAA